MTAFLVELVLATAIVIVAVGLIFRYWKKDRDRKEQLRQRGRREP